MNDDMKTKLAANPSLQDALFIRGFLITDEIPTELFDFPFYGNWEMNIYGGYAFLTHKLTKIQFVEKPSGVVHFLVGHAYNPITMEHEEEAILRRIAAASTPEEYFNRISELTGIFVLGKISGQTVEYLVDPAGMQSACSGIVNGHFYLTSHAQLVGDLCGLHMDPFVEELIRYKWYKRMLGSYLPADITPFLELRRVVPDHAYTLFRGKISHVRVWPTQALQEVHSTEEYEAIIRQAADILRNNMVLISRKWEKPWISLTGGIDSNTTFAAANGLYDRFETFSYISAEKEIPDAEAAGRIADEFAVNHHVFTVPQDSASLENFEAISAVLAHNNGYIAKRKSNETRKRIVLKNALSCDVEVKSWVSESIRAYWYKYFGRKRMPACSAKLYRNLYKVFLTNRKLAHKVDEIFEIYLQEYGLNHKGYDPSDFNYHEVAWGSWGGLNISEMKYYCDITIPYNNRMFLDLLLRVPLKKRIADTHHMDMKAYLNPELSAMNIRVKNKEETRLRAFLLNVIFTINMLLPF